MKTCRKLEMGTTQDFFPDFSENAIHSIVAENLTMITHQHYREIQKQNTSFPYNHIPGTDVWGSACLGLTWGLPKPISQGTQWKPKYLSQIRGAQDVCCK